MAPRQGFVARLDAENPPNFCDSSALRMFIPNFCRAAIERAISITVRLTILAAVFCAAKRSAIATISGPIVRSVTERSALDRSRP